MGCSSFVLAMPPRLPDDPKQLFPIVKGTMLRLLVDRLKVEPRYLELKKKTLAQRSGQNECWPEFISPPAPLEGAAGLLDHVEDLDGLIKLAKLLQQQRSGGYDRILQQYLGDDGYRRYREGAAEQRDEKQLLLALIEQAYLTIAADAPMAAAR